MKDHMSNPRGIVAGYLLLLVGFVCSLGLLDWRGWSGTDARGPWTRLIELAVLVALSACGYLIQESLFSKVAALLDMSLALVLLATLTDGAAAGFLVALTPDVVRLARRGRRFWNVGLLANIASDAATPLAAAIVLWLVPAHDAGERGVTVLACGLCAAAANYAVARAPLIALRDGEPLGAAIRREFLPLLPLELLMIAVSAIAAMLLPAFGLLVLVMLAALAYVPQAAVGMLVRAPSVARLSLDAAAAVYRRALADELGLRPREQRLVAMVDSLVEGHGPGDTPPANPFGLMNDAMLVAVCRRRQPTQRAFTASPRAQVVLVSREWAALTARCTPALSHREALVVLRRGPLAHDAPQALAAVAAIVAREAALTQHIAGVPRLHRLPLPRTVRRAALPAALARLTVAPSEPTGAALAVR